MNCLHRRSLTFAAGLALWSALATAAPLPGGLQVTATVSLDTVNSVAPVGSADQSGSLVLTRGGADSVLAFLSDPTTIPSPGSLTNTLTDTGDGLKVVFSMVGIVVGAGTAQTDGLFADYLFMLGNSSATETYTVTFRATVTNSVGANGADAFAFSDLSVLDAALNELFFSDHRVDTLNPGNNLTADSASNLFAITLLPGQSTSLTALQRQRGGLFSAGDYGASLNAFLSIDSVRVEGGNPNPVPLPDTLALFGAALLGLVAARRR